MDTSISIVLLAGGSSSRFWPFLDKNIISLFGKPNIRWHYDQLVALGIQEVTVVTNDRNSHAIRDIEIPESLHVEFTTQEGEGQGQAVYSLKEHIAQGPVIILNSSDSYSNELLSSFFAAVLKDKEHIRLGAVTTSSYFPGGYIKENEDKTIQEIVEKPEPGKEPSNMVRIVADYFPHIEMLYPLLETQRTNKASGYEMAINDLFSSKQVGVVELTNLEQWRPMKYPWHVLCCIEKYFPTKETQSIHPSVEIKKNVVIEGSVVIEEGVKIFEGTKIVGPVFIGKNTIIGNNNIIRHSHIGAFCVTGFSSDITRSYIGDNCWFHTNYIGDSVIGNNVSMGSGTVCANLRLDDGEITSVIKGEKTKSGKNKLGVMIGDNVRIGVNTSIMPGIKIGQDCFIGAGIIVDTDIPDRKFVYAKGAPLTIVDNTSSAATSRDSFRKEL